MSEIVIIIDFFNQCMTGPEHYNSKQLNFLISCRKQHNSVAITVSGSHLFETYYLTYLPDILGISDSHFLGYKVHTNVSGYESFRFMLYL